MPRVGWGGEHPEQQGEHRQLCCSLWSPLPVPVGQTPGLGEAADGAGGRELAVAAPTEGKIPLQSKAVVL